ncbi:MAG TPA: hypothetical protein VIR03_01070 [Candidatus Saccharimonadales bacterium]
MVNKKIGGRRRIAVSVFAALVSLGTFLQLVPVAHAADATLTWRDASTITIGGSALAAPIDVPGTLVNDSASLTSQSWIGSAPGVNMSFGCTATAITIYLPGNSLHGIDYTSGYVIYDMGPGGCTQSQLTANIPGLSPTPSLIYRGNYPEVSNTASIGNVGARGGNNNGGGQAVAVTVNAGMQTASDYTNLPANDQLTLCQATGAYVNNPTQLDTDCLAAKNGVVTARVTTGGVITIQNGRGPNGGPEKAWQAVFNNVKAPANFTVCSANFNACQAFPTASGQDMTVYIEWGGKPNVKIPGTPSAASDQTVNEPQLGCDISFEWTTVFSIKWLVCPFVMGATHLVGKLDDTINSMLTIDLKDIFTTSATSNAYHTAWNSFRFFALGLIVIAALIMVVSQAAGVEILDAYTIRKILPRLLFAAIFIALSWSILAFLVQLSNDVGQGIRTLIYAPFQGLAKNNTLSGGSSVSLLLISTGGILAYGFIGLLSFGVTAMLACLVAFAVLVFRKMLIILLLMMAPFAIAAYVLPSTQKLWTIWKDGLLSALLVYPIITGMIAIGRVFSTTAFNTTSFDAPGGQVVSQIIAVVAYFAPYFMISIAFRLAGGFIATIGGVVNDRGRGAFDRLKKYRGNKLSDRATKMSHGQLFQNRNPFARAFNSATGGVSTFAKSQSKMGFLTNKRVRDAAFAEQRVLNQMAYAQTDRAKAIADNDPALRAQTYRNAAEARANMARDFAMVTEQAGGNMKFNDETGKYERVADGTGTHVADSNGIRNAIAAAKANGGFGRDQQLYANRRLFATNTGFDNLQQAHETTARVAGGNRELAAHTFGYGNAESGKSRLDLKTGYGSYMNLYDKRLRGEAIQTEDYEEATLGAVKGNEALGMVRGKPQAVKNTMPVLRKAIVAQQIRMQDAAAKGDNAEYAAASDELGSLVGILKQYEQSLMYASPNNTQTVDDVVIHPTAKAETTKKVQEASNKQTVNDAGEVVDNTKYNPHIARGYNRQAPRGTYTPHDPRNQI